MQKACPSSCPPSTLFQMPLAYSLSEECAERLRSDWGLRTLTITGPLLPMAPQRAGQPVGRDGRLCQRGNRSYPHPLTWIPHGCHLGCRLGLLVQCPPSVPLAQGGPGLGAETLGCTTSIGLVVSNVVEGPKPRGKIIPSWGREGQIIRALRASLEGYLPF